MTSNVGLGNKDTTCTSVGGLSWVEGMEALRLGADLVVTDVDVDDSGKLIVTNIAEITKDYVPVSVISNMCNPVIQWVYERPVNVGDTVNGYEVFEMTGPLKTYQKVRGSVLADLKVLINRTRYAVSRVD